MREREKGKNAAKESDSAYPGWVVWRGMNERMMETKRISVDASVQEGLTRIAVVTEMGRRVVKFDRRERNSLTAELSAIAAGVNVVSECVKGGTCTCQAAWGMLQEPSLHRVVEEIRGRVADMNRGGWEGRGDGECGGGVELSEHVIDVCERDERVRMREKGVYWASVQLRRGGKMDLEGVAIVNDWAEEVIREE